MSEAATSDAPTAWVTGSSSGIGLAVSKALLGDGFRVVGLARREPVLAHERFELHHIDLQELDSIPERLSQVPGAPPDVAVLCAGRGRFGSLEEQGPAQIRELVDLDLVSPMLVAREILPGMKRRGSGRLIFIGSESARRAGAFGSVYSAAKFGLRGFAQSLRQEASRAGVVVSQIHPGMVRTPFFDDLTFEPGPDDDQALHAEDVADAVLFAVRARPGAVVEELDLAPLKKVVRKKKPASPEASPPERDVPR